MTQRVAIMILVLLVISLLVYTMSPKSLSIGSSKRIHQDIEKS